MRYSKEGSLTSATFMYLGVLCLFIITRITWVNLMPKLMMDTSWDIPWFLRPSGCSTQGDNKLRKHITLLLMRALNPSGSQIPQLKTLVLMTHQGIPLMSIILRTIPQPNTKLMLTSLITSSLTTYPNHLSVSSLKLSLSQMRLTPLNKLFRNP